MPVAGLMGGVSANGRSASTLYQWVGSSLAGSVMRSPLGIMFSCGPALPCAAFISIPPLKTQRPSGFRRACGFAPSNGYAATTRPPAAPKYHHHWRMPCAENVVNVAVRLIGTDCTRGRGRPSTRRLVAIGDPQARTRP